MDRPFRSFLMACQSLPPSAFFGQVALWTAWVEIVDLVRRTRVARGLPWCSALERAPSSKVDDLIQRFARESKYVFRNLPRWDSHNFPGGCTRREEGMLTTEDGASRHSFLGMTAVIQSNSIHNLLS